MVLTTARKPMGHQAVAAKWLLATRNTICNGQRLRGRILADDMGLGKTYSALLAAKVHKANDAQCLVVVIAPASLLRNWETEARLAGVKIDICVSNHHSKIPSGIAGNFVVICDEAHAFQNPDSARTKKLLALAATPDCQGIYLLTGTPVKNGRPHNLLPLLQAINHGIVRAGKIRDYLVRFCGPRQVWTPRGYVTVFDGATHLDELHQLTKAAILRRTADECLDLPDLTRVLREVELTADENADYQAHFNRLQATYRARLREGKIKSGNDKLVLLNQLRLAGSVAKARTAIDIAEEVTETGGQIVIFTCFRETAEKVAAHFGVPVFDGSASLAARDAMVQAFQSHTQKVFVGIDKAGGVGLTLHAHGKCRHVLLLDRPWTPGDALQLEKRAHRIGQPNSVNAVWLQHGTIDDKVDGIIQQKAENIEHILTGERISIAFSEENMADAVIDALGWND